MLVCLILSWVFDFAAVWNLTITIRNRSKELRSIYSGLATFFSFSGIVTWFVFALITVEFVETMTFGVWILISVALI